MELSYLRTCMFVAEKIASQFSTRLATFEATAKDTSCREMLE